MTHAASARPRFLARPHPAPDAAVLVLFCHPARHRSRVNRALADAIRDLPGVTFHDLYEAYPDYAIDVPFEQQLLLAHHTIVMQHPLYWYSTPALLKEWQDHVLEYGWAYGHEGTKLAGKRMLTACTTGGPATSYQPDGLHGTTLPQLLAPIAQTAKLCNMRYLPPFVTHGTHRLDDAGIAAAASAYRDAIAALTEAP